MQNSSPPSKRTRLRRTYQHGHYDHETIHAILDAGLLCHVGYVIDGYPYVTPTLYWRHDNRIYWHGSSASRMLRQITGVQVCLTVSHLDGLVLARSGFHHSANYRSVMVFGQANIIENTDEKKAILDAFVENLIPGRTAQLRKTTEQEIKATTLIWMTIDEASAKIRKGDPVDDEEDYDLPVWAGQIPLKTIAMEPIADTCLAPQIQLPEHVRHLLKRLG